MANPEELSKAEEALRESEAKYRMLLEEASDGIHTYDRRGRFLEVNKRLCEMLGYTREELLRMRVHDLVPAGDLTAEPIRFGELSAGNTLISERYLVRKDGTLLPAEISGKMLPGGLFQAIIRDISERKRVEEQLREAERFAVSTLDALVEHIVVLDGAGTIIATNQAWRDFAAENAATPANLCEGVNYLAACDRAAARGCEEAALFAAGLRAVMRGEVSQFAREYLCRTPSEELWFVGRVTRFHDREPARFAVSHENITAQKRTDDRLKQSEEWLRTILDASRDGILVEDGETIYYVNRAYARMLGYDDPEELKGRHVSSVVAPGDAERMLKYGRMRLGGGAPPPVYEFEGRRRDGSTAGLEASVSVSVVGGRPYITTTVRDIAERKLAEERLRRAHDELEQRVAERTAELERANETLKAEIAERLRVEETLRESEQRLRIALQTGRLGSWQLDLTTFEVEASDVNKANFGLPEDAELSHKAVLSAIHPEDRDRVFKAVNRALDGGEDYNAEYRVVWPDGSTHWLISRGRCVFGKGRSPLRMVGVTMDITERRQAEEAHEELLRRLVDAQEDERRRISRELHDQLGQRMTALMMGLKTLSADSRGRRSALESLRKLQGLADEMTRELHALAWGLRPPALDDLGLHTALYNYAEEWAERTRVTVDFQSTGIEGGRRLPVEVETALYRIAQEALTNLFKHSGADRASLILERLSDHVVVMIEDNGRGFDAEAALRPSARGGRLGLLGMRERAAMLGGSLNIESAPGAGTTVLVRVPLGPAGATTGGRRE
ncbi:MAG TPA: PAS domain S-box protein [Pyrinomonadaceae bacterium]|nr:PAS domain S-box protein [Pyrinomonadaceae bacterium]